MLEPIEDQYELIGRIARSHGVNGEILIFSDIEAPQLFDTVDLVHIQNTRGDLIPARIESVRMQQKNNRLSFFVKFEHINDRNQAERWKSCPVYVLREKIEHLPAKNEDGSLVAFEVTDEHGKRIGKVVDTIENPAQTVIVIDTGDQKQLLVPFVDEYVYAVNLESKTVQCQNLNQLADI